MLLGKKRHIFPNTWASTSEEETSISDDDITPDPPQYTAYYGSSGGCPGPQRRRKTSLDEGSSSRPSNVERDGPRASCPHRGSNSN